MLGGFDGTSNVLAGKLFNIPVKGTHAHAYVTSFTGAEDLANAEIKAKSEDYVEKNFYEKCLEWRTKLAEHLKIMRDEAHNGELAAFASYAVAFPEGFMALVDTYDVYRYRLVKARQKSVLKQSIFFPARQLSTKSYFCFLILTIYYSKVKFLYCQFPTGLDFCFGMNDGGHTSAF